MHSYPSPISHSRNSGSHGSSHKSGPFIYTPNRPNSRAPLIRTPIQRTPSPAQVPRRERRGLGCHCCQLTLGGPSCVGCCLLGRRLRSPAKRKPHKTHPDRRTRGKTWLSVLSTLAAMNIRYAGVQSPRISQILGSCIKGYTSKLFPACCQTIL